MVVVDQVALYFDDGLRVLDRSIACKLDVTNNTDTTGNRMKVQTIRSRRKCGKCIRIGTYVKCKR